MVHVTLCRTKTAKRYKFFVGDRNNMAAGENKRFRRNKPNPRKNNQVMEIAGAD
jgi:hypothetical protein